MTLRQTKARLHARRYETMGPANRWAASLFDGLTRSQRWDMADQLVHGTFNWEDWTSKAPPPNGVVALDVCRINWEEMQ